MIATDRALSVLPLAALFPLENERPTSEQRSNATATNHLAYQAVASTAATSRTLQMGRFVSVDKSSGDISIPNSLNGYAYANDNPVKLVDPDGESPALAIAIVVGAAAIGGVWRGGDYLLHSNEQTVGGFFSQFGIGAGTAAVGATTAIFTALGTANPFIVGAASGEASSLTEQLLTTGHLDPARTALDTASGAILGKATNKLFKLGPGRVPRYFGARDFRDLFSGEHPNVTGVLKRDLGGAFLGEVGERTRGVLGSSGDELRSVYGEGYRNFQLFQWQYRQANNTPGGQACDNYGNCVPVKY